MPIETNTEEERPKTLLHKMASNTQRAVSSTQSQPWYAKTVHVAVSVASVTAFVLYTSQSVELKQEGVIIMGTALVLIVYAFGGDGLKVVRSILGRGGNGEK
jgi:hypothetical protein